MPELAAVALGALGLLGIYFVLAPLIFPSVRAAGAGDAVEQEDVLQRRAEVYGSIKELEFERAMGRLGDRDFEELRRDYKREASQLLSQEDGLRSQKVQKQIEAEVARRRTNGSSPEPAQVEAKAQTQCSGCGATVLRRFRFCPECGHEMESA